MKVLIIEDEKPAAEKLRKSLIRLNNSVEVLGVLGSVKESVIWLNQNPVPELIFMDIELSDGLSFKIHEQVDLKCPVIFTTAYDEYWQEAFTHNSIEYLLKPVKHEKLEAALQKYHKLKEHFEANMKNLMNWSGQTGNQLYKKRFLVKRGQEYISLKSEEIAYFYAAHKLVCLVDSKGQKFILDESLSEIEKQVDPSFFYRVNRKYLVNLTAIKKITAFPKSKLQLKIEPQVSEEIIISQENVSSFKEWMGR